MKIYLERTENSTAIRVVIEKSEPGAAITQNVVQNTSESRWYDYTDNHWTCAEDNASYQLQHCLDGAWAFDAMLRWLLELPRALQVYLRHEEPVTAVPTLEYFVAGNRVADLEAIEQALAFEDRWFDLGQFNTESGRLFAIDPVYMKSVSNGMVLDAQPGVYNTQCLVGKTVWHHRVKVLRIWHGSLGQSVFDDLAQFEKIEHLGVDSGQLGFFDEVQFAKAAQLGLTNSAFYDNCSSLVLDQARPGGGVLEYQSGVVTASGYGDGTYPLYVRKNTEGKVIAAFFEFISEAQALDEDA